MTKRSDGFGVATRDRFNVGEVTRTDVAQAEARVAEAQYQVAQAVAEAQADHGRTVRLALGALPDVPVRIEGTDCTRLLAELDKVWRLFGHNADKVEVLWLGALPAGAPALPEVRQLREDPALRAALPRSDDPAGTPVYVIDPNGFVVLRFPPHADPAGLRTDVARLLKLK